MKNIKKISRLAFLLIISLVGCFNKNTIDDKNIIIGATSVPHAEILAAASGYVTDAGYNLVIKEFAEYELLNPSLEDGVLDANFFQHLPYLENYNNHNNANLVGVFNVHFEPLSLYKGKGDYNNIKGKIAIPNDSSNGARALLLLAAHDIIELDLQKGLNVSVTDIIDKKGNTIIELAASLIPSSINDVDYAVINGNYALSANIANDRIIFREDANSIAATRYANIIACKQKDANSKAIEILINALNRSEVKAFISEKYDDKVVPVF